VWGGVCVVGVCGGGVCVGVGVVFGERVCVWCVCVCVCQSDRGYSIRN